jgi:hypothetical protein
MNFRRVAAMVGLAALGAVACQAETTETSREPESREQLAQGTTIENRSTQIGLENVDQAIRSAMSEQYGDSFDSQLGCWRYSLEANGERYEYCMAPRGHKLVETDQGRMLYFFASNRSDIKNDPKYLYSLPDSGLMGAFALKLNSSSAWALAAASKDLDFGSAGNCGCESAKFVRLGRDYYGWMFVSGGVWQGVASLSHSLVAPQGKKFVDLSEIPMQTESDQDSEYRIEIDDAAADEDHYPLVVTKVKAGSDAERTKIAFDTTRWRYSLPK